LNDINYAAKSFYNTGDSRDLGVEYEENLNHLKDELIRQEIAANSLAKFKALAKSQDVILYGKQTILFYYPSSLTCLQI